MGHAGCLLQFHFGEIRFQHDDPGIAVFVTHSVRCGHSETLITVRLNDPIASRIDPALIQKGGSFNESQQKRRSSSVIEIRNDRRNGDGVISKLHSPYRADHHGYKLSPLDTLVHDEKGHIFPLLVLHGIEHGEQEEVGIV